ncbi:MAG: ankyrin repeat domain-containing protein [Desulfopila sp.]
MRAINTRTGRILPLLLLLSLCGLVGIALSSQAADRRWWQAVEDGQREIVAAGLQQGVSANQPDDTGTAPLYLALRMNRPSVAALLIVAGADINAQAPDGLTPLLQAIYHDQPGIVRLLVERGVDTAGRNRYGRTPLQLAVQRRYPGVIAELAMAGADIRQQLVDLLEAEGGDEADRQEIIAFINRRAAFQQPEDEDNYWSALEFFRDAMYSKDRGISGLLLVEALMRSDAPGYSPEQAIAVINAFRLRGLRESQQPLLYRWAQSGNSYAQALLGNSLVNSSLTNQRPLGRQLMLESACQGNPIARYFINDDSALYLPDMAEHLAGLTSIPSQRSLEPESGEDVDPNELLASDPESSRQLAQIQKLADCGVIQAQALLDFLENQQFTTLAELEALLSSTFIADLETPLAVANQYFATGSGREGDLEAGMRWLQRAESTAFAAEQMDALGQFYESGSGAFPGSAEKALQWYGKAAGRGSFAANVRLCNVYLNGELGVVQDLFTGLEYCRARSPELYHEKLGEIGPAALAAALADGDGQRASRWLSLLGSDSPAVVAAWRDALLGGNPRQAQLFVDAGVDVSQPLDGRPPLLIASEEADVVIVEWLLDLPGSQADPAVLTQALVAATWAGRIDNLKLLIDHGGKFPAVTTAQGQALIKQSGGRSDMPMLDLILANQPDGIGKEQIVQVMGRLAEEARAKVELAQWRAGMTIVRYDEQRASLAEGAGLDTASPWRCAGDSTSGLIWLVKDKTAGIHGSEMAFSLAEEAGQPCTTEFCSPEAYRDLARQQNICGCSDWRLPTVNELASLAYPHMEQAFPAWPGYLQWAVDGPRRELLLVYANGLLGHRQGVMAFGGAFGQVLLVRGQLQELPQPSQPDFTILSVQ